MIKIAALHISCSAAFSFYIYDEARRRPTWPLATWPLATWPLANMAAGKHGRWPHGRRPPGGQSFELSRRFKTLKF